MKGGHKLKRQGFDLHRIAERVAEVLEMSTAGIGFSVEREESIAKKWQPFAYRLSC